MKSRTRFARMACVGMAVLSLGLSACGGDDEGEPATGGSAAATTQSADTGAGEAAAASIAAPPTTPPETIPITEPLSKTPPKGKKVIFLQCELPSCERFAGGMKAATAALDWSLKIHVFKNSNPGAGLQQAVNEKPDYIAITGIPVDAIKTQLAAAKKAGIPVMSCSTTDAPSPDGYIGQCNQTLAKDAEYVASWAIKDSGAKANMVAVSIPQFPGLNTETDWLRTNLPKACPDCKYDDLEITIDDIGSGAVASKVVAYLQTHPDVNYVYSTFDSVPIGLPEALQGAGLKDKVKLIGAAAGVAIMKEIGGDHAAWTIVPNEYMSWNMIDAFARLSVGDELPANYQEQIAVTPSWVVDSKASADLLKPYGYDWRGPGFPGKAGFDEQLKKLWKVAG